MKTLLHGEGLPRSPRTVGCKVWHAAPGGTISGWICFGLGVLFFTLLIGFQWSSRPWRLFPDADLADAAVTEGLVQSVVMISNGRNGGNGTFRIVFTFRDERGAEIEGWSYTRIPKVQPGDRVRVDYLPEDPQLSRVVGTSAALVPPMVFLIPLPMFLTAALLLGISRRKIVRFRDALRRGIAKEGVICVVKHVSHVQMNNVSPWRLEFEFKDSRGQVRRGRRLVFPESPLDQGSPCAVGETCTVLQHPDDPDVATIAMTGDFVGI